VVGLNKKVLDAVKKMVGFVARLVHHRRVPNGCARLVFRAERSRGGGYMTGGAGINMAFSAQSRRMGPGVKCGGTGLRGGGTGDGGHETVTVGVMASVGSRWGV
jgi:hypothetical protein